jgi:hypothetical protein
MDQDWEQLQASILRRLRRFRHDPTDFLVCELPEHLFVQFSCGIDGNYDIVFLESEASGPVNPGIGQRRLSIEQETALLEMGWVAPENPEDNFRYGWEFEYENETANDERLVQAARFAIETLRGPLLANSPFSVSLSRDDSGDFSDWIEAGVSLTDARSYDLFQIPLQTALRWRSLGIEDPLLMLSGVDISVAAQWKKAGVEEYYIGECAAVMPVEEMLGWRSLGLDGHLIRDLCERDPRPDVRPWLRVGDIDPDLPSHMKGTAVSAAVLANMAPEDAKQWMTLPGSIDSIIELYNRGLSFEEAKSYNEP